MKITIKGYIICKEAENYSDCADSYAFNSEKNRFAISDGVTKSFFPKIWSKILVDNFVALDGETELCIENCQTEWLNKVTEKVNTPETKWFTKNAFNRREPGLATFVSLYFLGKKWFAKALGDSFLFFIPRRKENYFDDWIKFSSKSEPEPVFDNFPDYYSSIGEIAHGEVKSKKGELKPGTFYLMTDALAEWVFKEKEKALEEIQEEWKDQNKFKSSVIKLRTSHMLNNDDSSVLIIDIEDDGSGEYHYGDVNVTKIEDLIETEEKLGAKKEPFITEIFKNSKEMRISELDTENCEKEMKLSVNAEKVYKKCKWFAKSYKKALQCIENKIKQAPENEQNLIKEKLKKEYGISFKN